MIDQVFSNTKVFCNGTFTFTPFLTSLISSTFSFKLSDSYFDFDSLQANQILNGCFNTDDYDFYISDYSIVCIKILLTITSYFDVK